MRFLISVIDTATGSGSPDEMEQIDAFNQRLVDDGHWVLAGGLTAPRLATLIDNRDGAAVTEHRPLHESTEYVSGFWVIEAPDEGTAMALAADGSRACNRRVELRPFIQR